MVSERQIKNAKRYCREDYRNIKGYEEALNNSGNYDIHHINELTFTIDELKKMNMYYHRPASELAWLSRSEHVRLHYKIDPSMTKTAQFTSQWKGESVGPSGLYKRGKKLYKSGKIDFEEFQVYRQNLYEYRKKLVERRKSIQNASKET